MNNEITINLREFPVLAHDHRNGAEVHITVYVTKEQLQAAQIVGQSSKELIERLCDRQGYTALEIGRPDKLPIPIDMHVLVKQHLHHIEDAFNYCRGEEETTTIDAIMDVMGMGKYLVRQLLKQHGGFWIDAGVVGRKETVQ